MCSASTVNYFSNFRGEITLGEGRMAPLNFSSSKTNFSKLSIAGRKNRALAKKAGIALPSKWAGDSQKVRNQKHFCILFIFGCRSGSTAG